VTAGEDGCYYFEYIMGYKTGNVRVNGIIKKSKWNR
jgi:hypothetical protein